MTTRQEIINRITELNQKVAERGLEAERAGASYSAHMQLYNVAAQSGNANQMEIHRATMHSLLDVVLDSAATVEGIRNELRDLGYQLTLLN